MNNCKILNLCMTRGDTLAFAFEAEGLTISDVFFSCKKTVDDTEYIFQKTLTDGIELIDAESKKYRVRVAPEDTENIDLDNYYYDLQINCNDDIFTILKGILKIDYDITRGE